MAKQQSSPSPTGGNVPSPEEATVADLQERLLSIVEEMANVHNQAKADGRDLTAEEQAFLDAKQVDFDRLDGDCRRRRDFQDRAARLAESYGRRSEPDLPVPEPQNRIPTDAGLPGSSRLVSQPRIGAQPRPTYEAGTDGFRSLGEFARSVILGSRREAPVYDPRFNIRNAPTTYGSEGVGADGGFVVPPDFRAEIMQLIEGEDSLLPRTDQQVTSGNTFTVPVDESTPWQATGGIRAYWGAEGGLKSQSKPVFQTVTLKLHKLYALVPMTDEIVEDAPSLDRYLRSKAPAVLNYAITDAIINGSGGSQPLGILNSGALVTAAAEASQAADTIRAKNITDMWARLYAPWRSGAVWLINQDLEAQLPLMGAVVTDPAGTTVAGAIGPLYLPPGGLAAQPLGTIFGRPVIPTEACGTAGNVGDIILASLPQYLTVTKSGGIRTDVSMHLWFDYDVTAFRFVIRLAGQPWLSTPIARASGTNTLSAFVTLAAR